MSDEITIGDLDRIIGEDVIVEICPDPFPLRYSRIVTIYYLAKVTQKMVYYSNIIYPKLHWCSNGRIRKDCTLYYGRLTRRVADMIMEYVKFVEDGRDEEERLRQKNLDEWKAAKEKISKEIVV